MSEGRVERGGPAITLVYWNARIRGGLWLGGLRGENAEKRFQ